MKSKIIGQSIWTWVILGCACGGLGTGCIAQKADLQKIHKDLDQQITKIRFEKKELAEELAAARAAIVESQNLISTQKSDMAKMRSDLAPLNQQIKLMREQDLTSMYGQFELAEKNIAELRTDLTNQKEELGSEIQALQSKSTQAREKQQQLTQTQAESIAQQVDANNQTLTEKMTEFQVAFGQFKDTLGSLGTEISQTQTQLETLQTDVITQDQTLVTVQSHTANQDLSIANQAQSIELLQAGLKDSGTILGTQAEQQSDELTELKQQIVALQNKLDSDTQALRSFLEQDVKTAMGNLVVDMDGRQRPVLARIDALQADMETLGVHVQADVAQVQELSQSVVQLREAQEVMGSLLGQRGDEIIQQAGTLSERINDVESHQATLTEQLQSNTEKTSTHLTEVNASLTSVSQNLDQTTQSLTKRLKDQEQKVAKLNTTIQQLQKLKGETQGQIQQMQTANQTTSQLRQHVEQVNKHLQDLEIHQSEIVGKLDSDAQTTTTHLRDVNKGIKSVAGALEDVSAKLNKRIANQEQQLNRAITAFQSVPNSSESTQTNSQHLNELTGTMNQLQEVINTIGTKLGERVDQHEDRLGQLAKRVNRLQSNKTKK